MAMHTTSRYQRSRGGILGKLVAGILVLIAGLAGVAWVSSQFLGTRAPPQSPRTQQDQEASFFEYTVAAETGHIRVSGTANIPNGVILVGMLDKVGSGVLEVKEALVMNRLFAMEFGPELYVQYHLHGPQDALQAGVYRLSIEFDPSQQSPFAQESLLRSPPGKASPTSSPNARDVDPAIIRVAKTFGIGTAAEQQEAQAREEQYRQSIRQHLREALATLTHLWQRLHGQYQLERSKGGFSRLDPRAHEWQTWSVEWLKDLTDLGEKARLSELVSSASPYQPARDALVIVAKQLAILCALYFEVLTNERSPADRDIQRAEQVAHHARGDAIAQLGSLDSVPAPVNVENVKPTVLITSPVVNVRSGPGMSHETIRQIKKDDVLDFLGEQGEWFQVQLRGGLTGWVHRNVASKAVPGDGATGDLKRMDSKSFAAAKGSQLHLDPINLLSTPIAYIPPPTSDEVKIYGDIELELRDMQALSLEERRALEQRIVQRLSDTYGISPENVWNTYLKVQGWEIKP
jgi:Bacterial SH3 domain